MTVTYEDREIPSFGCRAIVAIDDGRVVGNLHYLVRDDDVVQVGGLVVASSHRGQRIARALCDELVAGPLEGKVAKEWSLDRQGRLTSGMVETAPIPAESRSLADRYVTELRAERPERFESESIIQSRSVRTRT